MIVAHIETYTYFIVCYLLGVFVIGFAFKKRSFPILFAGIIGIALDIVITISAIK